MGPSPITALLVCGDHDRLDPARALPQRWHDGLLGRTRASDDGQVQALADEAVRRWA